jgi:hypothetical protein
MLISDYSPGVYTSQGTIIFYYSLQASHPPKGISRFPDGGTHQAVYKNFSLYEFDTLHKKINKIHDFGKMTSSAWHTHLSLENNKLLFNIIPVMGRQWLTEPDTETEKYDNPRIGFYLYDLKTKELRKLSYDGYDPTLSPDQQQILYKTRDGDSVSIWLLQLESLEQRQILSVDSISVFSPVFWVSNQQPGIRINNKPYLIDSERGSIYPLTLPEKILHDKNKTSITEIKRLTVDLPFKEYGFELSEVYPKNKRQYIDDLVRLRGNFDFRKAIIEELTEDLTQKELNNIIEAMDRYAESLSGLEKTQYTYYSKDTKELLICKTKEKIKHDEP